MAGVKRVERDPEEIVHVHVQPGRTVTLHRGLTYGDRGTLQLPWREAEPLLAAGDVALVDPENVPEVSTLPG